MWRIERQKKKSGVYHTLQTKQWFNFLLNKLQNRKTTQWYLVYTCMLYSLVTKSVSLYHPLSCRKCTSGQFTIFLLTSPVYLKYISNNMEHEHRGPHFTNFYVITTVESRRNFRVIMEAFAIFFLSMEIVILVRRHTTSQNYFAHGKI